MANHQTDIRGVNGSVEKIFSGKIGKYTRKVILDRVKIGNVRERNKSFKTSEQTLYQRVSIDISLVRYNQTQPKGKGT